MEIFFDPILFGITCVALVVFIIGSLVWDYFKNFTNSVFIIFLIVVILFNGFQ